MNQKKVFTPRVRMNEALHELFERMIDRRGARDDSDYLRGLVIVDARAYGSFSETLGLEKPRWIDKAYPKFFAAPNAIPTPPPEAEVLQKTAGKKEARNDKQPQKGHRTMRRVPPKRKSAQG